MKIVLYGDSITDASRAREVDYQLASYGFGYPSFIAGELLNENPNGYEIINRGISGNRIVDLYARIKKDLWNLEPDVISILIGVNDVWHEIAHKNGVELHRFEKVYRMLLEDTKEVLPNAKIVLVEPFFLKGTATQGSNAKGFEAVYEYAKVVKKLADELNFTFVPLQEKLTEGALKDGAEYYLKDGVHPDEGGINLIANEWIKAFKENM